MKNVFKIGSLLLGIALAFCSCSDDDDSPFEGMDNYITGVTLTQSGKDYVAVIAGDSITVTVPYTVSLDGATVVFEHSELAVITPDPATITDWNNERQFRVTSYNSTDKRYIYRVIHADIYNEGDVVLRTQEDVAAFAASGATVISGNLVIGAYTGEEIINDLSGLAALKEVKGSIIVNDRYQGTDLSGLDHLQKAGSIKIGTVAEPSRAFLLSMVRFPKLKEVASEFTVNHTNVQWVQAPELVSVGESMTIYSESLTSVTFSVLESVGLNLQLSGITEGATEYGSMMKALEFPYLKQIGGKLSVTKVAALETAGFPVLTTVGGITVTNARSLQEWSCPSLENSGKVEFNPLTRDVDARPLETLDFGALKTIEGDLTLMRLGIRDLTGLSRLEKVSGTLKLQADDNLVSWDLVNLKQVGGITVLGTMKLFAPEVIDVSGVEFGAGIFSLRAHKAAKIKGPENFHGSIDWNLPTSTVVEGFSQIEGNVNVTVTGTFSFPFQKVTGDLGISGAASSRLLFPKLEEVAGNIEVKGGKSLSFDALTQVDGWLYVSSNDLATFSAPELIAVGKQLCLSLSACWNVSEIDLTSLETIGLKGPGKKDEANTYELEMPVGNIQHFTLPNLTEVRGDIFFDTWMDEAESIVLEKLKTVTGTLYIYNSDEEPGYTTLTTLKFPSLWTVGKIDIEFNEGLTDYSTFAPLFENDRLPEGQWYTTDNGYNPGWQEMKAGHYTE